MLELLHRWFIGHNHIWETDNITKVAWHGQDNGLAGYRYILKCKHCGKIKVKNTY